MRNFFFFLLCVLSVSLVSCGGDGGCDDDLTGTYTGSNDCVGITTSATVTIAGEDGDYSISGLYAQSGLNQDGCTLMWGNTLFGIGEEHEITFNGNEITIIKRENVTDITLCTFTGTK